jgi:hypothetical protein
MNDARGHLERSLSMLAELGDEQMGMQYQSDLGTLEREQDHLAASRQAVQAVRAVALRRSATNVTQQADATLAQLAVDEGHAADAERLARLAAAPFKSGEPKEAAATTLAVLARALLLAGKRAEALTTAERAWALVAHSEDLATRADARAAVVTIRASAGDCAGALREAIAFEREEASRQTVDERLEAALAHGTAELACGQRAAGRARLSSVLTQATRAGFLRIARLAR